MIGSRRSCLVSILCLAFACACGGTAVDNNRTGSTTGSTGGSGGADAGAGGSTGAPTPRCRYNSDCPQPLACAPDLQCRNQCIADRDCVRGQVCAQGGACADPSELNPDGSIMGSPAPPAPPPSAKCKLNSECNAGLICAFGLCASECVSSRDCPASQRCVPQGDPSNPVNVCLLISESACHYNTDCVLPLVCAADLQCRSECIDDRDCLVGQRCVGGVCADANDIDPNGILKGATDAGIHMGFPGGNTGGQGGTP